MKYLEVDGRPVGLESCPFELRRDRVIIDPHKTVNMEVSVAGLETS